MIISIFTPHGGCPERCHFCDQKVSGGQPVSKTAISKHIQSHLKTAKPGEPVELAFYGGTFTAMPRDRQLAYLSAVKPYLDKRSIQGLRIATRPDAIDADWIKMLRDEYSLKVVELGAQSFNSSVLTSLGRTHTEADTEQAVSVLDRLGLRIGLHLMIGCPEERDDEDEITLEHLQALEPDMVRLHPLLVIRGTELEKRWKAEEFKPLELETAIDRSAFLVEKLEALGIEVIRIGLQPNDLLGEAVVAGPYHPSFGDLVRGRIYRNQLAQMLAHVKADASVQIEIPDKISGTVKGPQSRNILWLKERFKLSSVIIKISREVPQLKGEVQVEQEPKIKVRISDPSGLAQRREIEPSQ